VVEGQGEGEREIVEGTKEGEMQMEEEAAGVVGEEERRKPRLKWGDSRGLAAMGTRMAWRNRATAPRPEVVCMRRRRRRQSRSGSRRLKRRPRHFP